MATFKSTLTSSKLESFKDSQRAQIRPALVAGAISCGTPRNEESRINRKLQALKRAHEEHAAKVFAALWLTSCQTLAAEYKYEKLKTLKASLKEDKALRDATRGWHRLLRDDDPQKMRKHQHDVTFSDLCDEASEFFMDQILEDVLDHTDPNSSKDWVFGACKMAVSRVQSNWTKVLNTQVNKECRAIYSSALSVLRKKGFSRFVIMISKQVRDYYRTVGVNPSTWSYIPAEEVEYKASSTLDTNLPTIGDMVAFKKASRKH